ncbi:alpha/beta family hydrolase [Ekhidna sp.]|jgi:predicted alpha/beta-hydrolase family hydrolase|uniref:alpha/beta hydrolase family protein n=1 Tax=Ekhidna sp. TaxID=2608089 RepID=UPI0032EBB06E
MELFLNDKLGKISVEIDRASRPHAVLIIAHGAGAGMHHPFMSTLARGIADEDIHAVRFNFPYMEQGRRSPGSPKANIETWRLIVEHIATIYEGLDIFISGKSYGGRMASHLMAETANDKVKGIIYYGFPLHAPGRDSKDRADHLSEVKVPQLFLQGSKDKLANIDMMDQVIGELSKVELEVIQDGDHSFNVPKKSGKTKEEVMDFLIKKSAKWIKSQLD